MASTGRLWSFANTIEVSVQFCELFKFDHLLVHFQQCGSVSRSF